MSKSTQTTRIPASVRNVSLAASRLIESAERSLGTAARLTTALGLGSSSQWQRVDLIPVAYQPESPEHWGNTNERWGQPFVCLTVWLQSGAKVKAYFSLERSSSFCFRRLIRLEFSGGRCKQGFVALTGPALRRLGFRSAHRR